jgi:drug/metabolite transporter (DMT)-like permease
MNYNFYILLIISLLIGSPVVFLKNDILKEFSITEEIIYADIGILIIVSSIYFFYENKSVKHLTRHFDSDIIYKFVLYVTLITIGLLIGNYIVKNEGKVVRYKTFQRSLSLILLVILGHFVFGERLNKNKCLGIGIVLIGLYIFDK